MAGSEFNTVAVLVPVVIALAAAMLLAAHLLGPRRRGPVKESPYESGMDPLAPARRRFHVRFYLVAVMYVVLAVEVVFLYPWALLLGEFQRGRVSGVAQPDAILGLGPGPLSPQTAAYLAELGYTREYLFVAILIFFALLAVGFVYEWRKGVFRWD